MITYKERKNTNCTKWDALDEIFGADDLLALWVADMDFECPSCVQDALKKYVEQGTFGYYEPEEEYYQAFINWEKEQHGYEVKKEWLRFAPGIVPAFNWLIHALTEEGDSVMILQPVYYPFKNAVTSNNRRLVVSNLVIQDSGCNRYAIDFDDMEQKIRQEHVKCLIFCSPHNPVSRVWSPDELKRVVDICQANDVYILSDEIHQDLIFGGHTQTPMASITDYDRIITLTAPSKTFNLASCQNSFVVIENKEIRALYDDFVEKIAVNFGNGFGFVAARAAYEGGAPWLEEVKEIIYDNYLYFKDAMAREMPEAIVTPLEGTYLMWVDLRPYLSNCNARKTILEVCKLAVDFGAWFGNKDQNGFIRINLATCRDNIEEAVRRLAKLKDEVNA